MRGMKSILINAGVFNANNSVRRNVGQYGVNYPSESETLVDLSLVIDAASSKVVVAPTPSVAVTVIRTSAPVTCQFLLRDDVTVVTFDVAKFLSADFDFKQLTITAGDTAATVELHQA